MNDILYPKVIGLILGPPGIIIVLGLLGLFMNIWRRWIGGLIIAFSFLAMFIMSVPLVGKRLLMTLEKPYQDAVVIPGKQAAAGAEAIVILGGGRYTNAPEFGNQDTVSRSTLERLRYGAQLASQASLPVLVSGGPVFDEEVSEAALMQQTLERDFGVKAKWIEGLSRTTLENALRTKLMLNEAGVKRVYLVTHAWHMERAVWAFVNAGVDVIPAPMGFDSFNKGDLTVLGYVPSAAGMEASSLAISERFGLYWYKRKRDAEMATQAVKQAQ